jgi:hypothetical protein
MNDVSVTIFKERMVIHLYVLFALKCGEHENTSLSVGGNTARLKPDTCRT